MKHVIFIGLMIVLLLLVFSNKVFADPIKATAIVIFHNGETNKEVKLVINGVNKVPTGLFSVNVLKDSSFRGIMYKTLNCKALFNRTLQVNSKSNTLIIKYNKNKFALGLYSNSIAIPEGIINVNIDDRSTINGKWNNLNCYMK